MKLKKFLIFLIILVAVATTASWGLQTDAVPEGAVPAPEETKMSNPSPTPDPIPTTAPRRRGDQGNYLTNVKTPENDRRTGWNLRVPPAQTPKGLKPTTVEKAPEGHETIVMGQDPNPPIRIVRVGKSQPTATTTTFTPVKSPKGHETIVVTGNGKPAPAPAPEKKEGIHPGIGVLIIVGVVFLLGFLSQKS